MVVLGAFAAIVFSASWRPVASITTTV